MDQAAENAWGPFEAILRELYLEKDWSLADIMEEMATKYQFKATKSQYELRFKKWQFRKNRTAGEWKIVALKLAERENAYKESVVVLNGSVIKPKKLRKETLRYGSVSTTIQFRPPGPSPPTPEGFVIRTPSPKLTTSMPILNAHPPIDISPILLYGLPFYKFNSVFDHEVFQFGVIDPRHRSKSSADVDSLGNPFLFPPENSGLDLDILSEDNHSTIFRELTGKDGKRVSGSVSDTIKALLPENIFPCGPTAEDMAISHRKSSSVQQFLKLSMYLASNNFFGSTTDASKKIYRWVKRRSNAGLLEYIFLSIGGPTVEALTENLFRLALDAEDVRTIKTMMRLGIDPNEHVYRTEWGTCRTPILQACSMQSLKLVRALIDVGARVDHPVGNKEIQSALVFATDGRDENYELKEHVDPELVRILLNAGAVVNPGSGESPLANAADWGHVEVVDILLSAGANVNTIVGDDEFTSTPLMKAIECETTIPDESVISIVRTLLLAGADPQLGSLCEGDAETPLEAAMKRKSIELIRLLLDNGSRVTERSFVRAIRFCDMTVVKLLLKSGGEVTETVIECAVEHNSMLVSDLLETADNRFKKRCKTAAFIESIKCGDMAQIRELSVSSAQLIKNPRLEAAIKKVITAGNMQVLSFLLEENSEYRSVSLESLGTGLCTAIRNGRHDIVELLLNSGAKINSGVENLDASPLLEAINKKDSKLAKQLLDAGAAVNGIYGYSVLGGYYKCTVTVLTAVVDWGHYPLIQDIINAGAEVDALEKGGARTSLFIAVQKNDKEAIKLLIDAGANVNAPGSVFKGKTALMAASRNNDLPTVRYLLELGADPDEWSLTVGVAGSVELVETLLEARLHRYKRYSRGYGCGALQHAIRLKDMRMIEVLLAKGIDANAFFNHTTGDEVLRIYSSSKTSREPYLQTGKSALGFAIESDKSNDSEIVRLLLQSGADPNSIVTSDQRTALLVAIGTGNFRLVKVLLVAGADANRKLGFGVERTPLQLAAEKGRIDIVHILLENGADVNMQPFDRYGATALQFAAIGGYIGIVQLLIQKGADINASPAKIGGRTALEGAAEHGRIDVLQLLLSSGAMIIGTGVRQYDRARELALENGHRAAGRLLENYNRDMWENLLSSDMFMDFGLFEDLSV